MSLMAKPKKGTRYDFLKFGCVMKAMLYYITNFWGFGVLIFLKKGIQILKNHKIWLIFNIYSNIEKLNGWLINAVKIGSVFHFTDSFTSNIFKATQSQTI